MKPMKPIEPLQHGYLEKNAGRAEPDNYTIVDKLNELIHAHNELLEQFKRFTETQTIPPFKIERDNHE